MGLLMASYGGLERILTGLTKSNYHPSRNSCSFLPYWYCIGGIVLGGGGRVSIRGKGFS